MKKKTIWGMVTAVAVAGVAVFPAVVRTEPPSAPAWPATKVALASVTRVDVPRAFHGVGALEAARQVELAGETAGRITQIAFTSGQTVKAGQVLVQLNDATEQAERLRLRAQLLNAETVLARTRTLRSEQVATQEQLEQAVADRDMAQGDLRRVDALIAQKTIRAPFAGTVGIRRVHPGQYLQAGEPIASLVDASVMHVNFSLAEQAVPQLQRGQHVEVLIDAWPDRPVQAKIHAIDPVIGQARTARVQAVMPNPDDRLKAGMFANVRVLRQGLPPVLSVPETALTYTVYGQTVYVAAGGGDQPMTVQRALVESGERWDGRVEIVKGLHEGDHVVVSGQMKLNDGMTVEAVPQDTLQETAPAQAGQAS